MIDLRRIEALYGPFAGQQIDIPADIADAGISEGWARDPFAPQAPPADYDDSQRYSLVEAAERAARAIRGEDKPKKPKAKPVKEESRELRPESESGSYKTRGPGRPSKE